MASVDILPAGGEVAACKAYVGRHPNAPLSDTPLQHFVIRLATRGEEFE